MSWHNVSHIGSEQFTCGWCGNQVASPLGFRSQTDGSDRILICPHCNMPTVFSYSKQVPGVAFGGPVAHLPTDIAALFDEARNCTAASCFTAAVLICRKLLMNVAVSMGAEAGGTFLSYVEYLAANGFVPPNGRGWVDHIRKKGNEATHEIVVMTKADAHDLVSFSEMLLKFVYEFPNRVPSDDAGR